MKDETPEEKAARLEAEAIAEQETAKRRIEATKARLLERQQREQVSLTPFLHGLSAASAWESLEFV